MGCDLRSRSLLPHGYGDDFPAFFTHRSAVDKGVLTSCDLFLTRCYFLSTKTLSHVRIRQYSVSFSLSLSCSLFLFFFVPVSLSLFFFSLSLSHSFSLLFSHFLSLSCSLSHTQTHKYTNTHVDTMRAYTSIVLLFLACSHPLVVSREIALPLFLSPSHTLFLQGMRPEPWSSTLLELNTKRYTRDYLRQSTF